jgi:ribonuclease D
MIASDESLADFCEAIASADYCAIDTEFVREKTYYPLLSLIQIATEKQMGCIDPFAIQDFEPLRKILQKADLLKVFHSPSQDLEILFQQFAEVPTPVFDTQLAAAVIGYTHQMSYADLVFEITGVRLEKKQTRADWSRRPLSDDELDYAMDDVRYLMPVYRKLKDELSAKNRLGWIERDLTNMSNASTYEVDFANLWQRLKGVQKLKTEQLQIASELSQWRERLAQKKDRPRRWIAADDWIIDIARKQPTGKDELATIRGIPEKIIERHGRVLLDIVSEALKVDPELWPKPQKAKPLSIQQQALGDCLMALCRVIADENNIALGTFATRKDIDSLIINRKTSRLAQGWRFTMAGEQLLDFIHAQSLLGIEDGKLRSFAQEG